MRSSSLQRQEALAVAAVDQHGALLDVLVQSRRNKHAAKRFMRKLLKKHGRAPRVLITDKLKSYAAANKDLGLDVEHRQQKGLNNRAENSHQPTRVREKGCAASSLHGHLQRFASTHDQVCSTCSCIAATHECEGQVRRAPGDGLLAHVDSRGGLPRFYARPPSIKVTVPWRLRSDRNPQPVVGKLIETIPQLVRRRRAMKPMMPSPATRRA